MKSNKFQKLLLFTLIIFFTIIFSSYMTRLSLKNIDKYEKFHGFFLFVSKFPHYSKKILLGKLLKPELHLTQAIGYEEEGGFEILNKKKYLNYNINDLLLISKSIDKEPFTIIELIDLSNFKTIKKWDPTKIMQDGFDIDRNKEFKDINLVKGTSNIARSPYLYENNDLLFLSNIEQLIKLDRCDEIKWINDEYQFHHNFNVDEDGIIWAIGYELNLEKNKNFDEIYHIDGYKDDSIIKLDNDGNILKTISLTKLLIDNNLQSLLFTGRVDMQVTDPLHFNDIQPVEANHEGSFFEKGDVFVSLAHINRLILIDTIGEKIKWISTQDANLFHQHDIDILNPNEIAIFNNNRIETTSKSGLYKHNQIQKYNFITQKWQNIFDKPMRDNNISTISQGLFEILNNYIMVEEQNMGRILLMDKDELIAKYTNGDKNKKNFQTHWPRIISNAGKKAEIRENIKKLNCKKF